MLEEQIKCPRCGALEYIGFFSSAKEGETFEHICCYCGRTLECSWYVYCDVRVKKGTRRKRRKQ